MKRFVQAIDWQRPWLVDLLPAAMSVLHEADFFAAINAISSEMGLLNHRGLQIEFVPQSCLPSGRGYENFISETGLVPTRENLHDFFNALVWLTFPKIKTRLNALHALKAPQDSRAMKQAVSPQPGRSRLRDAATIFDENAALLVTADSGMIQALHEHHWNDIFVHRCAAFTQTWNVSLFGHALLEKLVTPYKAITAHAWLVEVDPIFLSLSPYERRLWLDDYVSAQLEKLGQRVSTANFSPLPVAGVPGWWTDQDSAFYSDTSVFRPKRKHT